MCDSHVIGCQFAAVYVVNAQATSRDVIPPSTCALRVTYRESSQPRKLFHRTPANEKTVTAMSQTNAQLARPVVTVRWALDSGCDVGTDEIRPLAFE
jgi:hypothetical protein